MQQKILLRALILEDRPEDAELMAHELRRSGYDPQWQRVETDALPIYWKPDGRCSCCKSAG